MGEVTVEVDPATRPGGARGARRPPRRRAGVAGGAGHRLPHLLDDQACGTCSPTPPGSPTASTTRTPSTHCTARPATGGRWPPTSISPARSRRSRRCRCCSSRAANGTTPFDWFLSESIFNPLGMTDTAFGGSDPERTAALYTAGLNRNEMIAASVDRPAFASGGGGLVSTLSDYHRFTQLLRGFGELDGVRLLGDRTVRYMSANHLPGNADLAAFGRPLFAEAPFDGVGFGLGFSVVLDPVATHTHGSRGEFAWGGAASTAFWVDPLEDVTVVFLTQLLPSSTYPLRPQLRQLVYSALVDAPSQR